MTERATSVPQYRRQKEQIFPYCRKLHLSQVDTEVIWDVSKCSELFGKMFVIVRDCSGNRDFSGNVQYCSGFFGKCSELLQDCSRLFRIRNFPEKVWPLVQGRPYLVKYQSRQVLIICPFAATWLVKCCFLPTPADSS